MIERMHLEVPGTPVPKARPRLGKGGHTYTPKKTKDYELELKLMARSEMRGRKPFDGVLTIELCFHLPRPENWPKWKQNESYVGHTSKPDWDNLSKIIDGLNGVVWIDDAQITDAHVYKRYSNKPRLTLDVTHHADLPHSKTRRKP